MDILDKLTEKLNMIHKGFDFNKDLDTNIKNMIYGEPEELEIPPKLFSILKLRIRHLTQADILGFKQHGGEKNHISININPKKFDIRWDDIKILANKFGLTGLKYEDHEIRMWFDGEIIWDVIR